MSSPLLRTTVSLLLLQLFSRVFSFGLNQFLLRSTSPAALGVATMSFEVLRDTALFLLREGLRSAVIRTRAEGDDKGNTARQQTYRIPLLLSPILIPLFALFHLSPPTPLPAAFHPTLILYALSTLLELAAESSYLKTLENWESLTTRRVKVEGVAVGAKAVATLIVVRTGREGSGLLGFGVGQVVYSLVLLAGFSRIVGRSNLTWTLRRISSPPAPPTTANEGNSKSDLATTKGTYFDSRLTTFSWALTKQSVVKQFLTEGDKIVVGRLSNLENQGGYAVALNYGSLIARILFQPLEESSRLYFSRQLSSPTPSLQSLTLSSSLLSLLLLLQSHLFLIFSLLLPSYTTPALYHLLGSRWSSTSAPRILGWYVGGYLPLMGVNGISEAFFQSAAEGEWMKKGARWWGVCSAVFVGLCAAEYWRSSAGGFLGSSADEFLGNTAGREAGGGLGEVQLILINCVGMIMRIVFSFKFINSYFSTKLALLSLPPPSITLSSPSSPSTKSEIAAINNRLRPSNLLPKWPTILVFGISSYIVRRSEKENDWMTLGGLMRHGGVGVGVGITGLGIIFIMERKTIRGLLKNLKSKSD